MNSDQTKNRQTLKQEDLETVQAAGPESALVQLGFEIAENLITNVIWDVGYNAATYDYKNPLSTEPDNIQVINSTTTNFQCMIGDTPLYANGGKRTVK